MQERYVGKDGLRSHAWQTIATKRRIMDADNLVQSKREDAAHQLHDGPFGYRIVENED